MTSQISHMVASTALILKINQTSVTFAFLTAFDQSCINIYDLKGSLVLDTFTAYSVFNLKCQPYYLQIKYRPQKMFRVA